ASSWSSPQRGMTVERRRRCRLRRSAAVSVSSVDWPLTYKSRENARRMSDRSCKVMDVHPKTRCHEDWRNLLSGILPDKETRLWPHLEATSQHRRPSGSLGYIGFHHLCRINNAIKFLLGNKAEFQSSGFEGEVVIHGIVRDLRCLVITYDRRKSCHQHQRALNVFVDLLEVWLGPLHQELAE